MAQVERIKWKWPNRCRGKHDRGCKILKLGNDDLYQQTMHDDLAETLVTSIIIGRKDR